MGLLSIFGFGNKSEEDAVKTASEKNLRRLSEDYRKKTDEAISKRRAIRITKEVLNREKNTRRKPRC